MIDNKTKNWKKLKDEFKLLKPLHYGLIMCLSNENYPENKDGWLKIKEIMKIRNPKTEKLYFTSNKTSFPNYINQLISLNIVEKKEIKIPNRYKYRESSHYYYRLKQDLKTFLNIQEHIGNYDMVNNFYIKNEKTLLLPLFQNSIYGKKFLLGKKAKLIVNPYFDKIIFDYYEKIEELYLIEKELSKELDIEEIYKIKNKAMEELVKNKR